MIKDCFWMSNTGLDCFELQTLSVMDLQEAHWNLRLPAQRKAQTVLYLAKEMMQFKGIELIIRQDLSAERLPMLASQTRNTMLLNCQHLHLHSACHYHRKELHPQLLSNRGRIRDADESNHRFCSGRWV